MSAVSYLVSLGIRPVSEGGKLGLFGLKALDPARAREALDYAREHKPAILAELGNAGADITDTPTRGGEQAGHPGQGTRARYARLCADYWQGCFTCPDCNMSKLYFCNRHQPADGGWLQ